MKSLRRIFRHLLWLGCFLCGAGPGGAVAQQSAGEPLTVFAAASLTDVLQEIGKAYAAGGAQAPRMSFAASSVLARQIEAGARADIFLSADQEWMDYLAARGLIRGDSRVDIVGNRLVLVAPASSAIQLEIRRGFDLRGALGPDGKLATGDPDIVPVGRYARAALQNLAVWADAEPRLVRAENVRAALAFVARGEAPLGIVYATDARIEPKVRVVGTFPADSHPPIVYPVALVRGAQAAAFPLLDYLRSDEAAAILTRAGFIVLEP